MLLLWRRTRERGSPQKYKKHKKKKMLPAWIRCVVLLFALSVAALQPIPAPPDTTILAVHAAHTAEDMDADTTHTLDLRVDASLRLFGASDPAGETELKDIAQRHPSYARAPFYLGLMSQNRGEPEVAVGFYAAALRAGGVLVLGEPQGILPRRIVSRVCTF